MKIAVASSDGNQISPHFGRSACFLVFDVEDGKIVGREVRANTFTAHARGECEGEGGHNHEHGMHSHASIEEALSDCSAVLCYGMGWRASEALNQAGVQAYVLGTRSSPEDAVALFVEGKLPAASGQGCPGHE